MPLKFSKANAKTRFLTKIPSLRKYLRNNRKAYSLDLLSGWTCPAACDCKSMAMVKNGRRWIKDGSKTQFRCFSASQEVLYPSLYNLRQHNTELIRKTKSVSQIVELILQSLPINTGIVRYHVGGDFFKASYLQAAIKVAELMPDVLFYGYTKVLNHLQSINMVCSRKGIVRDNFLLTASKGGKYDNLIPQLGLRHVTVFKYAHEVGELPLDHNDSHAATPGDSFALIVHGPQPSGEWAIATKRNGGYRR